MRVCMCVVFLFIIFDTRGLLSNKKFKLDIETTTDDLDQYPKFDPPLISRKVKYEFCIFLVGHDRARKEEEIVKWKSLIFDWRNRCPCN